MFNGLGKGIISVLDATNAAIDYLATPLVALDLGIRTTMLLGLGLGLAPTTAVIGGIVGGITLAYAFNKACKYSADALLGADKAAEEAEAAATPRVETTNVETASDDRPVRERFSDAGKTTRTPRPSFATRAIRAANDKVRNALGDGPMAMPVPA